MPAQAAWKKKQVVRYENPGGKSRNATVVGVQGVATAAPGLSTSTAGGTLAAATYSYKTAAIVDGVPRPASPANTQVTTGATSSNTITAPVVTGATAYRFYGRVGGAEGLLVEQASNVYVDTGAASVGAAPTALAGDARIFIPSEKRYVVVPKGVTPNTYSYR
jgi:hypothetical protein